MPAADGKKPGRARRVRVVILAALLALSLTVGVTGATTPVSAAKRQPAMTCRFYDRYEWILISTVMSHATAVEDPGPGGYWDCNFGDS
jgi:hypothetical protein